MTIAAGEKMFAADILNLTFFPKGTILMFNSEAWNAASAEFRKSWRICNGQGGTPNLVGKFLRGGTDSDFTNAGGADSQSIRLEIKHMPRHNHSFSNGATNSTSKELTGWVGIGGDGGVPSNGVFTNRTGNASRAISAEARAYAYSTWLDAGHSHNVTGTISETGGGSAASGYGESFVVNTMPSHFTVIYIIKVA
jgi:hypothetical protein